ncbi:MAG: SCO family protein [Proteobacteria bacterium]|nr:SCO family protein [Pseudomonadota bacterium]
MSLTKNVVPVLALALALIAGPMAFAHSLKDLESMLGSKEKFFQPLDKEAPGFTLRNADAEAVRLADFRGKVVVLHFVYAGCLDVCPLHADRIAEIQEMVNQTPMKEQVQFITITTDPKNDTLEVLRDYGPAHGLDPVNWTFLTTTPDQPDDATRKLAESFGHKFIETEDGYQVHSVVTHVIDGEGRWRGNFHGLRFAPTNLVLFINALADDAHDDDDHDHAERNSHSFWQRVRSYMPW